jgi:primosomal replication protein N
MLKNNVSLSVIVSKDQVNQDGTSRLAIRKISDSLTVINSFVSGGKKPDGTYNDSASIEVHVTSKTQLACNVQPGSHIDVEGFLSPKSYEITKADGTKSKRTYLALVAKTISQTEQQNNTTGSGSGTLSANTGATSAPAPAPAPETPAAESTAPVVDYSDDLPFN